MQPGGVDRAGGPSTIDERIALSPGKLDCRACVCRCFDGQYASGTFRHDDFGQKFAPSLFATALDPARREPEWLIDNQEHAERLFNLFWPGAKGHFHPQGLIIVAGATKSGKSQIARALALRVLLQIRQSIGARVANAPDRLHDTRLPHLVTFEDPIEEWQLYRQDSRESGLANWRDPAAWLSLGLCFTPRKSGTDVSSLQQALRDARRQTPACFFVGEVRSRRDWREVFDFAGSGHLIIVTTHAGSLVESMLRAMDSIRASTPQARRTFANNLRGCVHLRMASCSNRPLLLPAVWRQQPEAINSLVAEGPSSITSNGRFVLGRYNYLTLAEGGGFRENKCQTWLNGSVKPEIAECAFQLDLEEVIGR